MTSAVAVYMYFRGFMYIFKFILDTINRKTSEKAVLNYFGQGILSRQVSRPEDAFTVGH